VREREDANRPRVAGHLDEIQGVVANTLNLFRQGAVGFIDWLDLPGIHMKIALMPANAKSQAIKATRNSLDLMPLAIAIVLGFVFGAVLTFWHRRLMGQLHAAHPDVWQRLGRGPGARLWPLSLRFPIWSWPNMFFFVTRRYERLGDRSFSAEAAK
jgi:hypothetical protein